MYFMLLNCSMIIRTQAHEVKRNAMARSWHDFSPYTVDFSLFLEQHDRGIHILIFIFILIHDGPYCLSLSRSFSIVVVIVKTYEQVSVCRLLYRFKSKDSDMMCVREGESWKCGKSDKSNMCPLCPLCGPRKNAPHSWTLPTAAAAVTS